MKIKIDQQKLDSRLGRGTVTLEGTIFGAELGRTYEKEWEDVPTGEHYRGRACMPKTKPVKLRKPATVIKKPEYWVHRDTNPNKPEIPTTILKIPHMQTDWCGCENHYNATDLEFNDARLIFRYNDRPNFPMMDMQSLGDFDVLIIPNSPCDDSAGYMIGTPNIPKGTPIFWQGQHSSLETLGVKIEGLAEKTLRQALEELETQ